MGQGVNPWDKRVMISKGFTKEWTFELGFEGSIGIA